MAGGNPLFADAVFEGGGVKGIGLVGALGVLEQAGYRWRRVAGTSAGAIVAALVAAGYTAEELARLMRSLDYRRFQDTTFLDRLGPIGMGASLLLEKGVYEGAYLERWLDERLADKGIATFADLRDEQASPYKHRLQVVAADISNARLVVIPSGLSSYGIEADGFRVSRAVRMSMSIPFFFEPVVIGKTYFVDGGLLSNFPVWLFDRPPGATAGRPRWPTFGLTLIEPEQTKIGEIDSLLDYGRAILYTMLEAHDRRHIEAFDYLRTIAIPTVGVQTTEFDLSSDKRERLYASGQRAAKRFLEQWDHQAYLDAANVAAKADPPRAARWRARVAERSARTVGSLAHQR